MVSSKKVQKGVAATGRFVSWISAITATIGAIVMFVFSDFAYTMNFPSHEIIPPNGPEPPTPTINKAAGNAMIGIGVVILVLSWLNLYMVYRSPTYATFIGGFWIFDTFMHIF